MIGLWSEQFAISPQTYNRLICCDSSEEADDMICQLQSSSAF